MTYHVVIKEERRTEPARMAMVMPTDAATQLHTQGAAINSLNNIAYAAAWDMQSPWVAVTVGDVADLNMAYAGWPMLTQEQWNAANPAPEQ